MYKFTQGPEEVSLMKGMDSWFRDNITEVSDFSQTIGEAIHMFQDPEYKEVCLVDDVKSQAIIYNEASNGFVTLTNLQPEFTVNYLEKVLGTKNLIYLHRHNDFAAQRGTMYGVAYETYLTLLVNPSKEDIGIFNNFEWLSEVFNNDPVRGLVDQQITFDEITLWNDYQSIQPLTLTIGDNVKRRMRKWRFIIPRVTHARDMTTVQTKKYARFRDSHLFAKFSYTNTVSNRRITIHDITTSVSISNS